MPGFDSDLSLLGRRVHLDDRVHDEVGLIDGPWLPAKPLRLTDNPAWRVLPPGKSESVADSGGLEVRYAFQPGSRTLCLEVAAGTRLVGPLRYRHRTIAQTDASPLKPLLGAVGVMVAFGVLWWGLLPNLLDRHHLTHLTYRSALWLFAVPIAPLGICITRAISAEAARRRRADFDSGIARPLQVITQR